MTTYNDNATVTLSLAQWLELIVATGDAVRYNRDNNWLASADTCENLGRMLRAQVMRKLDEAAVNDLHDAAAFIE